jgi:hypothetical protein
MLGVAGAARSGGVGADYDDGVHLVIDSTGAN